MELALLLIAALILVIGTVGAGRAYDREPAMWFFLGSIGGSLWVLAYALIELASTRAGLLFAARFAFVGPMLGAPALYLLCRAVLLHAKAPTVQVVTLFLASFCFHVPALVGPYVIADVEQGLFQHTWIYGNLAPLPGAFWLTLLIAIGVLWVKERRRILWSSYNRMIWLTASLLCWQLIAAVTNIVFVMFFEDTRYYYLGPTTIIVPYSVIAIVALRPSVPDLWGALGRLFPNRRSKFVRALEQLEKRVVGLRTVDSLLHQLSSLLDAQVSLLPAQAHYADASSALPGLWVEPKGWDRLYAPGDRERLIRISDKLADLRKGNIANRNQSAVTGWSRSTMIEQPRPALWPLGSIGALRTSNFIMDRLQSEPVVLLLDPSRSEFLEKRIISTLGRVDVHFVEYPDAADEGARAGKELAERVHEPGQSLIIVRIETTVCAERFEEQLNHLAIQGAKVVGICAMSAAEFAHSEIFYGRALEGLEVPSIEITHFSARAEDVSVYIDMLIMELRQIYGFDVFVTPEERAALIQEAQSITQIQLRSVLERMLLDRVQKQQQMPMA